MKKLTYLFVALFIISCSSSDDDSNISIPDNYFPLAEHSYWTYDNESNIGATRDSLYVAGIEETNGVNNTVFGAQQPVVGFMTTLFSQSLVRGTETQLIINGEIGAPPIEGFPDISIPLEDVLLYNTEADNGTLLSEASGEIEQDLDGIPIIISYSVSTVQGEMFNSFEGYNDVISSKIIVNLSIVAEIEILPGVVLPIPILAAQDIMTVTNYYANTIGLISSENFIEYELQDLSEYGIEFPFPSEDSRTATQDIDTYEIGN